MSSSHDHSSEQSSARPSSGSIVLDIAKQAALSAGAFVVVSTVAGPIAGAIAAALVGGTNSGDAGTGASID